VQRSRLKQHAFRVVRLQQYVWQQQQHQRTKASQWALQLCCSKIAEAEAGVSVNEKKWLVMHVHVQMRLDALQLYRGQGSVKPCDLLHSEGCGFCDINEVS
jgi:hypothetical protein